MKPRSAVVVLLLPLVVQVAASCGSDPHEGTTTSTGPTGPGGPGGGQGASGGGGAGGEGTGAGASTGCEIHADCDALVPETNPPGCAQGRCDALTGVCTFEAQDADRDGYNDKNCVSLGTEIVETGEDCDDTDEDTHPGAWDGPEVPGDASKPDRCDDKDQDCSRSLDQAIAGDVSCECPGDEPGCSQTDSGEQIVFPPGPLVGPCKLGIKKCEDGRATQCLGAVGPVPESCDTVDNDCNGVVDDLAAAPVWRYDGDGDDFAANDSAEIAQCAKPNGCPANQPLCTDPTAWKINIPEGDCDDADEDRFPTNWDGPAASTTSIGYEQPGLAAEYFSEPNLLASAATRTDLKVAFTWNEGSPDPAVPANHWSARWTGTVVPPGSGSYTFYATADDGVRLYVAGNLVVDSWQPQSPTQHTAIVSLTANVAVAIVLEYFDDTGTAAAKLEWSGPSLPGQQVILTQSQPQGGPKPAHCDGIDQDCDDAVDDDVLTDGVLTRSCTSCSFGTTLPCGVSEVGECHLGVETCLPDGAYGECSGAQGSTTEACNGKDDDCNGTVDNNVAVGPACDNGGVGACKTFGQMTCTNGSYSACNAAPGGGGDNSYHTSPYISGGYQTWDWDCSGAEDKKFNEQSPSWCGNLAAFCGTQNQASCSKDGFNTSFFLFPCQQPPFTCGGTLTNYQCAWNGSFCQPVGQQPDLVQLCK